MPCQRTQRHLAWRGIDPATFWLVARLPHRSAIWLIALMRSLYLQLHLTKVAQWSKNVNGDLILLFGHGLQISTHTWKKAIIYYFCINNQWLQYYNFGHKNNNTHKQDPAENSRISLMRQKREVYCGRHTLPNMPFWFVSFYFVHLHELLNSNRL